MRFVALLLLMIFLPATAIPLPPGSQAGFLVDRRGWFGNGWSWTGGGLSGEQLALETATFPTLTVLDSTIVPMDGSGPASNAVLWKIAIRDSLIGGDSIRTDTASLAVVDEETFWARPSCLVAWDYPPLQRNPIF